VRRLGRPRRAGIVAAVAVGAAATALAVTLAVTLTVTGGSPEAARAPDRTTSTSAPADPSSTSAAAPTALPATGAGTAGVCQRRDSDGGVPAGTFPGEACTGVIAGSPLTPEGDLRITQAGSTWEDLDVSGNVCVAADDVTIRNSRVIGVLAVANEHGNGFCGVAGGAHDLTLVDVEVRPNDVTAVAVEGGVYRPGITCVRCNLHRAGAGINGGLYTLIDTYIHDLLGHGDDPCCWSHNDGIQIGGAGGNVIVRHSNIEATYAPESTGGGMSCALCLYTHGSDSDDFSWGPMDDVLIEGSRIQSSDAVYCAHGGDSNDQNPTNIRYRGNVFVRSGSGTCGLGGPITGWRQGGGNQWSNNTFSDGEVIPEPATIFG
jgi:hypothetical protein